MALLRVLHIAPKMLSGGGIENVIMNYYRRIDKSKVQFDFLVHSADETEFDREIRRLGGKIHRVTHYHKSILQNMIETMRIFAQNKEYSIVHIHTSSGVKLIDGIIARLFHRRKVVFHSHTCFPAKSVKYALITPLFRMVGSYFLACSKEAGEFFFGSDIASKECFRIMKNAIDIGNFLYDESKRQAARQFLNVQNQFVIGHVGRFTEEKNHPFLLSIFQEVQKILNNSTLVFVGEGPTQIKVREKGVELGLESRIMFTGVQTNVGELLQAMDVFVFPSHYEGLGLALIEAQAAGLCCLASDIINPETNVTGNVEFLSIHAGPRAWADKIIEISSGHSRSDHRVAIAAAGYDIEREAIWLEQFYLGIAESDLNL